MPVYCMSGSAFMLVHVRKKFSCVSCVSPSDFVYPVCIPKDFFVYLLCIPRTVVPATVYKAPMFEGSENFPTRNPPLYALHCLAVVHPHPASFTSPSVTVPCFAIAHSPPASFLSPPAWCTQLGWGDHKYLLVHVLGAFKVQVFWRTRKNLMKLRECTDGNSRLLAAVRLMSPQLCLSTDADAGGAALSTRRLTLMERRLTGLELPDADSSRHASPQIYCMGSPLGSPVSLNRIDEIGSSRHASPQRSGGGGIARGLVGIGVARQEGCLHPSPRSGPLNSLLALQPPLPLVNCP